MKIYKCVIHNSRYKWCFFIDVAEGDEEEHNLVVLFSVAEGIKTMLTSHSLDEWLEGGVFTSAANLVENITLETMFEKLYEAMEEE